MKRSVRPKYGSVAIGAAFAVGLGLTMTNAAAAGDFSLKDPISDIQVNGWLRGWASINLQDDPQTTQNDRGSLSMLRGEALFDTDFKTGPIAWKAIVRANKEVKTTYIRDLESKTNGVFPGGPGSRVMDQYDETDLREFYADIDVSDNIRLRLGKQQVVWGETDFFRAMDLIHGYDYRWRSFLEPENEQLRKPLVLANAMIQVPSANGALQVIVRPGLDRKRDIGNTYDLYGGRWTPSGFGGLDFINGPLTMQYDYNHPEGDVDHVTGGMRWKGDAGGVTYSIAAMRTFNPDPIVNSAFAPYSKTPSGPFGDWIFPEIDLLGVTASTQVEAIDSIVSTEIVYTKNAPYNVGFGFPAGFGGVIKKKTIMSMLRVDKPIDLKSTLGTSGDSFLSFQVFDKWILDYKKSDQIVDLAGFTAPKAEHSTVLTAILATNFASNTINPTLAMGIDPWNSGGFIIPSVEIVAGDNWRFRAEADIFFSRGKATPTPGFPVNSDDAHLFGYFAGHNQFVVRITRLF